MRAQAPAFVSVILCTRDRAGALGLTLDAIEQSCSRDRDAYRAELIIVDNASVDETAQVAKAFTSSWLNVRYIYEPQKGKSICLNRALAEARGEIILLTDDDMRPQPEWIATMCAPICEQRADAVAGGIIIAPHLRRDWMTDVHRKFLASTEAIAPSDMDYMIGANCAFSRKVLDGVPGFDPELGPGALGFCEDILFSLQLVKAGYRLTAIFDHPSTHYFDPAKLSRRSFVQRAEAEGRSVAYIAHHWEHREIRFPFLRLCAAFVRLQARRLLPGSRWAHKEGIVVWEFRSIYTLAFRRQYLRERRRVRHYGQSATATP